MERRKRILVTPLDWGLGHATRCIPIINKLQQKDCEVLIASSGYALLLMKEEFPNLKTFELAAYNPTYSAKGDMIKTMLTQLPKFLKTINSERIEVESIVKDEKIDVVISDNRYGCYSKQVKSVFITHQQQILMPNRWKWIEEKVNTYNHQQIGNFSECWVPAPNNGLLGHLQTEIKGVPTKYVGWLSRFNKQPKNRQYDVLVICSGPEPQRSLFEEHLLKQLQQTNLTALVVRGKPDELKPPQSPSPNIKLLSFLNSAELNEAIEQSGLVISRSGYSTIMDLAKLEKKAVFIPTPGQTEQQYLAQTLMQQKIAFSMEQKEFNLEYALQQSKNFSGFTNFVNDETLLEKAIESIL